MERDFKSVLRPERVSGKDFANSTPHPRPPLRNGEGEQNGSQRFFESPLHVGEGIRGEVNELTRNPLRAKGPGVEGWR
jgi:hypothetical protein